MTYDVGEPVQVGEFGAGTYTVGIAVKNNAGKLISTGSVFVTLPSGVDYPDEQAMLSAAKSQAIEMVVADPGLLTPVRVPGSGGHKDSPDRPSNEKTPWSAGNSKHKVDRGAGNSKAILSPESPEVDI